MWVEGKQQAEGHPEREADEEAEHLVDDLGEGL